MSNEETKKVKSLIEQCMLHYLNKNEAIDILYRQEKIDPSLTITVWEKLEQQNQEFFKGYYLRVILKEQMTEFNYLLEKQAALINQMNIDVVASPVESTGSAMSPGMQSDCDFPMNTFTQKPNVGMLQGTDGLAFDSNSGYFGNLRFDYEAPGNLLESCLFGMQSDCDFPMNTFAQNPNVGMLQGTDGLAFKSDSCYLGNFLEAHQFATPPDYGFCPLPLVSNDQQSTTGTGQNMNSTSQDFWQRFVEQSQRSNYIW